MAATTYYVALAFKRSEDNGEVVRLTRRMRRPAPAALTPMRAPACKLI
jgi:hypothetical protein